MVKYGLRVFKGKILKKILELKKKEVTGSWKSCIIRIFMICIPYQISFGTSKQGARNEYGMMEVKKNAYRLSEELGLDGNIILKWI
jgi:hypothetical protein